MPLLACKTKIPTKPVSTHIAIWQYVTKYGADPYCYIPSAYTFSLLMVNCLRQDTSKGTVNLLLYIDSNLSFLLFTSKPVLICWLVIHFITYTCYHSRSVFLFV